MASRPKQGAAHMRVVSHQLSHGSSLVLPKFMDGDDTLIVVLGGGKGCVLRSDEALAGIWIPLRGRLQCGGSSVDAGILPGETRVTEIETGLHASGRGNALWIAILGNRHAWRDALTNFADVPQPEPALLPALHPASHDLRRHAAQLARAIESGGLDMAIEAVLDQVIALQRKLAVAIARCPGRTYAQRRQVFLRLQRVRNYLAANCHLDLDNEALARMASYSPWHFIRAFRAAYQETPHAYLVSERLHRARRLLRSSPLAIAEIALASGFENRCAFSRLFRQRFGTTAGAVRRNDTAVVAMLEPAT
jgi:AraC family transcriptional regulator